jgi:hypothetical protein
MPKLKVGDRIIIDHEEVVWDFFNNLLGMANQMALTLNLQAFHRPGVEPWILVNWMISLRKRRCGIPLSPCLQIKLRVWMGLPESDVSLGWLGRSLKWISWLLSAGSCRVMLVRYTSRIQHTSLFAQNG